MSEQSDRSHTNTASSASQSHWAGSLRIVWGILIVWFVLSLGCGVLLRDFLDQNLPKVGNAPFGFWMAQQGAIMGFVVLLFIYMFAMNRLDSKHGYDEREVK